MAITIAALSEAVRDVYTAETITDVRILRAELAALRYYSRYNPIVVTTSLSTVANTYDYTLPSDCIQLLELEYWPYGSPYSTSEDLQLWADKPIAANIADQVVLNIDRAHKIEVYGGYWEVIVEGPSGTVRLSPIPTSVIVVPYRYYKGHAVSVDNTNLATVPAEDLEILRDLVVVELLTPWANSFVTEPDYVRGLGKVTKKHLPDSIAKRVSELQRGVQQRYGGSVCVIG